MHDRFRRQLELLRSLCLWLLLLSGRLRLVTAPACGRRTPIAATFIQPAFFRRFVNVGDTRCLGFFRGLLVGLVFGFNLWFVQRTVRAWRRFDGVRRRLRRRGRFCVYRGRRLDRRRFGRNRLDHNGRR